MSRHIAQNSEGEIIAYGWDRMGVEPGLFLDDEDGNHWDSRQYLADPGCILTPSMMVTLLQVADQIGFENWNMDKHINAIQEGKPF